MPSNVHGYRDLEADAARAGRDRRAGQRPAASERTPINPGHGEEGLLGISMVARPASGILPTICETITPRFKCKTLIMAISLIEIAIFISELVVGQVKFGAAFSKYNPMAGPDTACLKYMGGKWEPCIRDGSEVWRLVTPIFLHAGVIHIGSNLFFQCMLGFTFEKRWTALRLGLIYLLTGVAASLLSVAASPKDVSVGASGALFGLVGADCSYLFMNWSQIPQRHQECCFLVFIILINLLFGFTSNATNDGMQANVDNFAHIGGLVSGAFAGLMLLPQLLPDEKTKIYRFTGTFLFLAFVGGLSGYIWGSNPWPGSI